MSYDSDTGGVWNAFGLSLIQPADGSAIEHPRTSIRNLVVARLVACVDTAARVRTEPALPAQARPNEWALPAFIVSTGSETSEASYKGPMSLGRTLSLTVEIQGADTNATDVERLLDSLALGVEILLQFADWPTYVSDVVLTGTERQFTSDGARRSGTCRLEFQVQYQTALSESAPQL